MSSYPRIVNLTTRGNLPIVPAGLPVISDVDGVTYDFVAGRAIVYDPKENITLDAAGISTAKQIRFGVTHSSVGGYMADSIRHFGHDDINLCKSSMEVNVQPPQCSMPQVIDFEFGCTFTGEDYMVEMTVDDNLSRGMFKDGYYPRTLLNMKSMAAGCTNCSEEENCDKLACILAAKIRGEYLSFFANTPKFALPKEAYNTGIWAAQKYANTLRYTLIASAVENPCDAACAFKALKSIKVGADAVVTFKNAVDPQNPTQTLLEQMRPIMNQINAALEGKGTAFLDKTDCCTYVLEINSCVATVVLTLHDNATITPVSTAAFSSFTEDEMCIGCVSPESATFTCGVRIIIDPLELPCNCMYPAGMEPNYYGRSLNIYPVGDSWDNASWRVIEVKSQVIPSGTGFQIQQREFVQSNGGNGFDYLTELEMETGRFPVAQNFSAARAASVADCNELYCVYSAVIKTATPDYAYNRLMQNVQTLTYLNIPVEDDATIASVEGIFAALETKKIICEGSYECLG